MGFSPGGGTDVVMRVVAKYLEQDLGVPVNIVNQPGGNRIPAVLTVLDAQPDGYWLLCEQEATSSIQSLISDLPYKIEDRTFGPMFAIEPAVFVVGGDSPWNSLQDVADAAKADPSSFTWTRLGGTSFTDFSLLQFFVAAGVDVSQTSPVDFDGSGPGITAVAGDHVMFGNTSVGAVLPLLSAGKLKVLAVTSDKRVNALPDVPTTSEAGFADVNLSSWYAISGPQGLPQEVVDRLDEAALRLSSNEAFQGELELLAVQTKYVPSSQMRDFITSQIGGFQDLSKAAAGN